MTGSSTQSPLMLIHELIPKAMTRASSLRSRRWGEGGSVSSVATVLFDDMVGFFFQIEEVQYGKLFIFVLISDVQI